MYYFSATIYTEKTIIPENTCTPIFTEVLFTIARTWKQPKWPSIGKWRKDVVYIWKRKGYPLQYSGLENPRDCIVHGVANTWAQLSNFHYHWLSRILDYLHPLIEIV